LAFESFSSWVLTFSSCPSSEVTPLEPLRDRAQPAGEPLDVGRGGDPERAHGRLLRLERLLARLERPRQRAGDHRVPGEFLGDLSERLLALAGQPLTQPWVLTFFTHGVAPSGGLGGRAGGQPTAQLDRTAPGTSRARDSGDPQPQAKPEPYLSLRVCVVGVIRCPVGYRQRAGGAPPPSCGVGRRWGLTMRAPGRWSRPGARHANSSQLQTKNPPSSVRGEGGPITLACHDCDGRSGRS
jgi:hypothetical protein